MAIRIVRINYELITSRIQQPQRIGERGVSMPLGLFFCIIESIS